MRIDENFDWLVRDLGDRWRNVLAETGWRIEYDDSIISDEEGGLPTIVGDDVNAPADIFDRIAESWVDFPELRLYVGQDRNVALHFFRRRLGQHWHAGDGSKHQNKYDLLGVGTSKHRFLRVVFCLAV